ncbi:DUF3667 domain-containing protein [Novosphingobium sp.]|uniref:DUF3667 domain-containing protein n=1 Tax=Novosphingobium sp. TaxID=1874826 RepID=UPI0025CE79F9|nr:DUF3667 domain-containing protein [Novosphingobium sp.]
MSGSGEIIGGIAEGAMAARAVEPTHGEAADGHSAESACLNCGTALVGSHCHSCGQAAHVHKTIGAFLHDLLHGVFHFEGKIWRTLPLLAWRPGKLTREYIDGRRASYISPIALFLFSVFLMFAVIKQAGGSLDNLASIDVNGKTVTGLAANERELAALRIKRDALAKAGKPTDVIDGEISGREAGLASVREVQATLAGKPTADSKDVKIHSELPAVEQAFRDFRANPGLGLFKLQTNAYKFSWALIPISVPFVWLLFPFSRRFRLYDHTVFVTYSLCFMTLLTTAIVVGNLAGASFLAGIGLLVPPIHMYRQLRGTYQLSRLGALWRTGALLFIAASALILFTVLIVAETGG